VSLKDDEGKNPNMNEHPSTWRKKLRVQELVEIARVEQKSGKEFEEISDKLEDEMLARWRLVKTTRKQYLDMVKRVLDDHFVLVC